MVRMAANIHCLVGFILFVIIDAAKIHKKPKTTKYLAENQILIIVKLTFVSIKGAYLTNLFGGNNYFSYLCTAKREKYMIS